MDAKGIETVRRDSCKLVSVCVQEVLNLLLIQGSVELAQEHVRETLRRLNNGEVDMSLLVITKALSKTNYKSMMPHVEVQKKMLERDPGSAPVVGDRVPYVIVQGTKGQKASQTAEDPLYALNHNIPLDIHYYIEQQLKNPLIRIFEVIIPNPHQLFTVNFAVKKQLPTSSGILLYTKRVNQCLGCRSTSSSQTLCKHCEPNRPSIMKDKADALEKAEERYRVLWEECHRCQGSVLQEVICGAKDCPIFFMRTHAKRDYEIEKDRMQKLLESSIF